MFKKGFTLIEVMVVVVILGVLSAVAVPKLFGHIAKAKAAEVPVAAGTYVRLQQAYLSEGSYLGSWQTIGYEAPGNNGKSNYFEYSGCIGKRIPMAEASGNIVGWQAANLQGMNSCDAKNVWTILLDPSGPNSFDYRKVVSSSDCAVLTSNWNVEGIAQGACEGTLEQEVEEEPPKKSDKEDGKDENPDEGSEPVVNPDDGVDDNPVTNNQEEEQPVVESQECKDAKKKPDDAVLSCDDILNGTAPNGQRNGWCFLEACNGFVSNAPNCIKKKQVEEESTCRALKEKREAEEKARQEAEEKKQKEEEDKENSEEKNNSSENGTNSEEKSDVSSGGTSANGTSGSGTHAGGTQQPTLGSSTSSSDLDSAPKCSDEGVICDKNGNVLEEVTYSYEVDEPYSVKDSTCEEYAGKSGNCKKWSYGSHTEYRKEEVTVTIPSSDCKTFDFTNNVCTEKNN